MMLTGLYVPVITPFDESGSVDLDSLVRLATRLLAAGATGLVALGTTGEPAALTARERRSVIEVTARVCRAADAPLLVGAADPETLAGLRRWPQVAAALTVVPPFVRPGEDGVLAHFARLAAGSPVPLVVYHVPYRTGQRLSARTLRRLAALPGVVGVKYAAGAVDEQAVDLLADPPPGFAVLAGDDLFVSPLLALGAHGAIAASAHLATSRYAELVRAWRVGDVARARPLGHRLAALSAALFAEPNPTVIKAALCALGEIPTGAVRLPLLPAGRDAADRALRHADPLAGSDSTAPPRGAVMPLT
jgi:4-hydroxy-tetrahydrodipicolinate synthase